MVQPTSQLLLRPATSLAAKFSLLAHAKVPLTPNESRQLLKVLKASFRYQLDKEHGASSSNSVHNCPNSLAAKSNSSSPNPLEKRLSRPNTTPTDRHVHNILSNPLFSYQARPTRTGPKDPMDVFEQACANGVMTVSKARACLHAKKGLLRSSPEDAQLRMQTSGSGSQVFKWLLSTGAANDSSWLRSSAPGAPRIKHDIVIEFLVLEGKQEALWDLFEHYVAHKIPNSNSLLYQLSKNLAHSVSMDAGYESVVRANEILNRLGVSLEDRIVVLHPAVSYMVTSTRRIATRHAKSSPTVFDLFLGTVQAVAVPVRSPKTAFYIPHLHLCHPTKPDAGPALRYLKRLDDAPPETLSTATLSFSGYTAWLVMASATHLLERGQYDDARWVLNFARKAWPEQIGLVTNPAYEVTPTREQAEADATSLEMLNNLELGLGGA